MAELFSLHEPLSSHQLDEITGISWSSSTWHAAGSQAAAVLALISPSLSFQLPHPWDALSPWHCPPLACLSLPFMVSLCVLVSASDSASSAPAPEVFPALPLSLPSSDLLNASSEAAALMGKFTSIQMWFLVPWGLWVSLSHRVRRGASVYPRGPWGTMTMGV